MNIKQNLKKNGIFYRSKIGIFDIFFKRLREESFEDLEINGNRKFQARATMSLKMAAIKVFAKLHKSPLLIANVAKGIVQVLQVLIVQF